MSLSVRDQSFCDFGAGESKAPSSQRALNAQETRCTGGFIKAVGAMMRMLLIWLLAFSTFVGVGCEEIGPSPTASLLDKYYLAPPSSLLDSEYLAFSFRWHGFQPRCVAKRILFRSWGMRSCSATRVVEISKAAGPVLQYWRQVQADHGGFVVSLSSFYNEPGWMETQLNLPCVEGLEPEDVEVIPGPPIYPTSKGAGAMDVSLPVLARRRAEAKIEANRERERSRGRSGPLEYVAPKMLAAARSVFR